MEIKCNNNINTREKFLFRFVLSNVNFNCLELNQYFN